QRGFRMNPPEFLAVERTDTAKPRPAGMQYGPGYAERETFGRSALPAPRSELNRDCERPALSCTPVFFSPCLLVGMALLVSGCTSFKEFIQNGLQVGPNYVRPPAPLAPAWIDAQNPRVKSVPADYSAWWSAFRDPVLNDLVRTAYAQNINLRVAGTRVLETRAQRAIAVGTLFPQQQTVTGSFQHIQASGNVANVPPHRFFDNSATGFNASWEVDFWGRFRRTIESADDAVESSVDDYDNVMVTLIGDLATAYVQYRIIE